jgi:hypothetical protein
VWQSQSVASRSLATSRIDKLCQDNERYFPDAANLTKIGPISPVNIALLAGRSPVPDTAGNPRLLKWLATASRFIS